MKTLKNLRYDVVCAGGGASGVFAAVAAARTGARVLLGEDRLSRVRRLWACLCAGWRRSTRRCWTNFYASLRTWAARRACWMDRRSR